MADAQRLNKDIEVFISYSNKDEDLKIELDKHLKNLERLGVISTWSFHEIEAGDEWQGTINDHLNSAQIILLLISPDFMASDYSYDVEMARALERHESGDARVIPIILRHVDWTDAPFTKLQFLPSNSKPVTSEYWGNRDKAFLNIAQGISRAIKKLTSDSSNGSARPPLIVDQMERGGFPTIKAAIDAAERGDQILVRQGVYDEAIIINIPLEIIGDGGPGDVVIRTKEKDTVLFEASRGRIYNLMIRQNGGSNFFALNIAQGNLVIDNCDISSNSLSCIYIRGNAFPKIRKNRIHSSMQNGIILVDKSQGLIEENDIFSNGFSGISIEDGSDPTIRKNRIRDNKMNGISITTNSLGSIIDNEIFRNGSMGVEIETYANPMLLNNIIYNNKQSGICINKNGHGSIENNSIYDNFDSGIVIHESNPSLLRNRIHDNNKNISAEDYDEPPSEEKEQIGESPTEHLEQIGESPTEHLEQVSKSLTEHLRDIIFQRKNNLSGAELSIYSNYTTPHSSDLTIYPPLPKQCNAGVLIHSGDPIICQNKINKNHGYGIFILNGKGVIEDNDLLDNKRGPYFTSQFANFRFNRNKGMTPKKIDNETLDIY